MNIIGLIVAGSILLFPALVRFLIPSLHNYVRSTLNKKVILFKRLNELRLQIKDINDKYPGLSDLGDQWTPDVLQRIHEPLTPEDIQWARYYSLMELCLSYCLTARYGRELKLIGKRFFNEQYLPYIRGIFKIFRGIISDFVEDGTWRSIFIRNFREGLPEPLAEQWVHHCKTKKESWFAILFEENIPN